MGQRYAPLFGENNDIIAPDFFVQGMADLAGEFNAGLDRDNLPSATITSADLTANVFFETFYAATDTAYVPDMESTSYQNGTGTTTGANNLGILSLDLAQDAQVDVHWSATWSWDGSWSEVGDGVRPERTNTVDTVTMQIDVDGNAAAPLGPFEDGASYNSVYGVASFQLPAGPHTLRVRVQAVRIVVQSMQEDGVCTNNVTFGSRALLAVARYR